MCKEEIFRMNQPYDSYNEIMGHKEAWQEAVEAVKAQTENIRGFFDRLQPDQVLFLGCTSPFYAGSSAAQYWQSTLGIPVRAVTASELIQFPTAYIPTKYRQPVLIALSRTGRTTETIWAVEEFEKRFPGRTIYIGCAPGSPLARMASLSVIFKKAYEKTIPALRSISSMLLASLLAGALLSNDETAISTLCQAPSDVDDILGQAEPLAQVIGQAQEYQNVFCLGSGPLYGVAQEGTLKMIEMSLTNSLSFPFLESRHGPRALVDENSLVIGLYSHAGLGYEAQVMDELTHGHHATTVAIVPRQTWSAGKVTLSIATGCDWPDAFLGLSYLPVLYLLAYYRALARGVNPDISRNLTHHIEIVR
jgi:glucosamine--fructose-6-phosphate aminotransferase (isomerizing)